MAFSENAAIKQKLISLHHQTMTDLYADLRKHAGSNHPQKGRLNVVLAAVEEIICDRNGISLHNGMQGDDTAAVVPNISPSDYFAAFMTALEGGDMSNMEDILALMVIIIQYVPTSPLRAKFKLISSIYLNIGKQLQVNDNEDDGNSGKTSMLKNLLSIFSHVIKVQECTTSSWQSPACLKSFDYMLCFIDDKRPKIRKAAHIAIFQIMQTHYNHNPSSSVLVKVSDLCIDVINKKDDSSVSNATVIHYLSFMNEIAYMIPQDRAVALANLLFALSSISGGGVGSNSMLLSNTDRVLVSLVPKLSYQAVSQMLQTMLTNIPSSASTSSSDKVSHFNKLLSASIIKLHDLNQVESFNLLPNVVNVLTNYCEAQSLEIVGNSVTALNEVLTTFLTLDFFDHKNNTQQEKKIVLDVLSSLSSFLEYRFQNQWTLVFPVLGNIFKRLSLEMNSSTGSSSSSSNDVNTAGISGCINLLSPLLKGLVGLHDALELTPSAAPNGCLEIIESITCDAAVMFGPHVFLSNIPLASSNSGEMIANNRLWCLQTLRQSIKQSSSASLNVSSSSSSLSHFRDIIHTMIRHYENEIKTDENVKNSPMLIKSSQNKLLQLWGLFPAYCIRPYDIVQVLPILLPTITKALKDPSTQMIICHAIKTLVSGDINSISTSNHGTEEVDGHINGGGGGKMRVFSEEEKEVMAQVAKKVLPILFKLLDEGNVSESSVLSILETTTALSNCAQPAFVNVLFKTLLQKLLQATLDTSNQSSSSLNNMASSRVVIFCDLAISLIPVLDDTAIALLYNAIKPMISMDENAAFQKRCYRILHMLCDHHPNFTLADSRITEILSLLTGSLLTCHVSSRTMRLRCLISITSKFDSDNQLQMEEYIPNMLGEVMLCTKDSNGKAREAAYELLLTMCTATNDNVKFISIVLAGLGARTPHMKSAAVMSLSHVLYFAAPNDDNLKSFIPELLSTVIVLLHEQAREIIKSVISFIRIGIALCPPDLLQPLVPQIVTGIMKWAGESKNRFRAKVKLIMKKLCRLYGFEAISNMLPKDDQPLISYLQRMANRSSRKREQGSEKSGGASASGGGASSNKKSIDEMLDEEEEDSDEEEDEELYENKNSDDEDDDDEEFGELNASSMFSGTGSGGGGGGGRDKKRKQETEFLMQDHGDDGGVVDLLDDSSFMKHVKIKGNLHDSRQAEEAISTHRMNDVTFSQDGRMIIPKYGESSSSKRLVTPATPATTGGDGGKRKRGGGDNDMSDSYELSAQLASSNSSSSSANNNGVMRKKQVPKNKSGKNKAKHSGNEYKAKKGAGGDVKKAGELEPYAYIPLDGKTLTNKKKKVAVEQYANVLFSSGSAKGAKSTSSNQKSKKGGRR